jgi:hypothetical protein
MPVTSFSRTPADNNSNPPNGWPEGQSAASVNNCARQLMTDIVNEAAKNQCKVLASVAGTNTITASMTPDLDAYAGAAGMFIVFTPANANTGAATLNIDSLGALDILKQGGIALEANDLVTAVPAILVLDAGADDFILLNPQTLTTLSVSGALTLNGVLTTDNTTADEVGYKGLPQNPQTGNYTTVLADCAKHIYINGSGLTMTIAANASVAYPLGTVLAFFSSSAGTNTIAINSDTLRWSGTSSTGSRTIAANGEAYAKKITSTVWLISGTIS